MPNTPRNTRATSSSQSQAGPSSTPTSTSSPAPTPNTRRSVPVVEMPSSRSSARATSSSTPKVSTPTKNPRSSTSTPIATHHHKTADEIAIEEAEEILENVDVEHGDARSRRHEHLRLSRLRSLSIPASSGPEIELGEEIGSGAEVDAKQELVAETVEDGDRLDQDEIDEGSLAAEVSGVTDTTDDDDAETETAEPVSAIQENTSHPSGAAALESHDDSDDTSDANSDDDTSATSDSDTNSEADSDDDDAELERLLQAAKVSATKSSTHANEVNVLGGDGDVVSFDQEDQEKERRREAPIPDISITKMPKPHLSFSADGSATAADAPLIIAGPSRKRSDKNKSEKIPELDDRPYERAMSKREKAAQPRKATVSELWSTLPAPKADILPQMRRDYQALSLSNSLDPKRFMKGGNRSGKIPETFAIGTLVEAPRHLQDTTLTREKQYRPGQLVQSLTRDEDTGSYAKRKYGDLQSKRMENGRGNGWKKQRGWKP